MSPRSSRAYQASVVDPPAVISTKVRSSRVGDDGADQVHRADGPEVVLEQLDLLPPGRGLPVGAQRGHRLRGRRPRTESKRSGRGKIAARAFGAARRATGGAGRRRGRRARRPRRARSDPRAPPARPDRPPARASGSGAVSGDEGGADRLQQVLGGDLGPVRADGHHPLAGREPDDDHVVAHVPATSRAGQGRLTDHGGIQGDPSRAWPSHRRRRPPAAR